MRSLFLAFVMVFGVNAYSESPSPSPSPSPAPACRATPHVVIIPNYAQPKKIQSPAIEPLFFTVKNIGDAPATNLMVAPEPLHPFNLEANGCLANMTLNAGAQCVVRIELNGETAGRYRKNLRAEYQFALSSKVSNKMEALYRVVVDVLP